MSIETLQTWVHTLRYEAKDTISVDLRAANGQALPGFEPGAHIDLHLPNGMVRSYSLCNDSSETHRYVVAVLKDKASRGGSRSVHEQLRIGMQVEISAPRNHFRLHEEASHTVLVAGGIGVTPVYCMAQRLKALGSSFEMICLARSREFFAFQSEIQALGVPVRWHFDDEQGGPPDLSNLIAHVVPSDSVHLYACGPAPMLDAYEKACTQLGLVNAHMERFTAVEIAPAADAHSSYQVELRRSGVTFEVTPQTSLHDMLIRHNADVAFSCEEGMCGSCETRVIEGEVDHRDLVLTKAEQSANRTMMVCVSGCKSNRLVLDL